MSVQYCEGIHGVTEYLITSVIFHCNYGDLFNFYGG